MPFEELDLNEDLKPVNEDALTPKEEELDVIIEDNRDSDPAVSENQKMEGSDSIESLDTDIVEGPEVDPTPEPTQPSVEQSQPERSNDKDKKEEKPIPEPDYEKIKEEGYIGTDNLDVSPDIHNKKQDMSHEQLEDLASSAFEDLMPSASEKVEEALRSGGFTIEPSRMTVADQREAIKNDLNGAAKELSEILDKPISSITPEETELLKDLYTEISNTVYANPIKSISILTNELKDKDSPIGRVITENSTVSREIVDTLWSSPLTSSERLAPLAIELSKQGIAIPKLENVFSQAQLDREVSNILNGKAPTVDQAERNLNKITRKELSFTLQHQAEALKDFLYIHRNSYLATMNEKLPTELRQAMFKSDLTLVSGSSFDLVLSYKLGNANAKGTRDLEINYKVIDKTEDPAKQLTSIPLTAGKSVTDLWNKTRQKPEKANMSYGDALSQKITDNIFGLVGRVSKDPDKLEALNIFFRDVQNLVDELGHTEWAGYHLRQIEGSFGEILSQQYIIDKREGDHIINPAYRNTDPYIQTKYGLRLASRGAMPRSRGGSSNLEEMMAVQQMLEEAAERQAQQNANLQQTPPPSASLADE